MKTYEDFLVFLEDHLKSLHDFIPVADEDFHPVCFAVARFLLSEPYRWEKLLDKWPHVPHVKKPEKKELIDFFETHKGLPRSFAKELKEENFDVLHKAHALMYLIFVQKDDFISSIFREDARARKYKKIFNESEKKIKRITEKINGFKHNPEFHKLIKKFTSELAGFSLTLINNNKLLDQTVDKLPKLN